MTHPNQSMKTDRTEHFEVIIDHAKELIKRVYQTTSVGGCAHVVLDDNNVSIEHIDWCLGFCSGFEYGQQNPGENRGDIQTQIDCLKALRELPYKVRLKLVQGKL